MDDGIERLGVQADNNSIAIGNINITGTVTGDIRIGHTIIQPADARLRRDLNILLKNVETTWIRGVLERSVHDAALLDLGMELRSDMVDNPWHMVMEKPDRSHEVLPRGRKIKDIFEEANRLLLILGEPGSGKTTTLLQLARDLIAEEDPSFTQPVPVILNLSTWTNKKQPLEEWLIGELNSKYRLPKKDGKDWLEAHRILPLLDGLDEVKTENRESCVEKINQLIKDYGLQGLVVCSRIHDYLEMNIRLQFHRAVYLQPLTVEQVEQYLDQMGNQLAGLRATFRKDETLRSMAQSPLLLSIMSLAYRNVTAEEFRDQAMGKDNTRPIQLFDTYITRMLNRKAGMRMYEAQTTHQRLSWLAHQMQLHNQDVFLIEGLQPTWLFPQGWRWVYFFSSRLFTGMLLMLLISWLRGGYVVSTVFEFVLASLAALSLALIDGVRFQRLQNWIRNIPVFWQIILNFLVIYIVFQLTVGLSLGLYYYERWGAGYGSGLGYSLYGPSTMVVPALIFGLVFSARASRRNLEKDIDTVEALRWSSRAALRGGGIGGLLGLLFALVVVGLPNAANDSYWLDDVLRSTFGLGLLGAIYAGIRSEIIATKLSPNQGIRLSLRNAVFGGLLVGLCVGMSVGSYYLVRLLLENGTGWWSFALTESISGTVSFGLPFGLIGALWYGGFDIIQHYTLRLILLLQGHTSANYVRFLDYAVDHIFLQKVGGGYRFIHRLLLEHFAEMYTEKSK